MPSENECLLGFQKVQHKKHRRQAHCGRHKPDDDQNVVDMHPFLKLLLPFRTGSAAKRAEFSEMFSTRLLGLGQELDMKGVIIDVQLETSQADHGRSRLLHESYWDRCGAIRGARQRSAL
ncbi:hypothetical protein [Caballeronia sp. GAWG2-1]|uniref:hypothetical protein n=1 Tax=Caballeronia sp. GAWG2-1 TaxID=2921744 RepID=UPI002027880A|nr:hypothetical protein [Caballeronia sp. GAWG2-1]